MSTYVTLSELKSQTRCDDGNYNDSLLQRVLEDAEAFVILKTRRTGDELVAMGDGEFPKPLRRAVLMLAAHWYANPEGAASAMQEIPYGISATIKPFVRLV